MQRSWLGSRYHRVSYGTKFIEVIVNPSIGEITKDQNVLYLESLV